MKIWRIFRILINWITTRWRWCVYRRPITILTLCLSWGRLTRKPSWLEIRYVRFRCICYSFCFYCKNMGWKEKKISWCMILKRHWIRRGCWILKCSSCFKVWTKWTSFLTVLRNKVMINHWNWNSIHWRICRY